MTDITITTTEEALNAALEAVECLNNNGKGYIEIIRGAVTEYPDLLTTSVLGITQANVQRSRRALDLVNAVVAWSQKERN